MKYLCQNILWIMQYLMETSSKNFDILPTSLEIMKVFDQQYHNFIIRKIHWNYIVSLEIRRVFHDMWKWTLDYYMIFKCRLKYMIKNIIVCAKQFTSNCRLKGIQKPCHTRKLYLPVLPNARIVFAIYLFENILLREILVVCD